MKRKTKKLTKREKTEAVDLVLSTAHALVSAEMGKRGWTVDGIHEAANSIERILAESHTTDLSDLVHAAYLFGVRLNVKCVERVRA